MPTATSPTRIDVRVIAPRERHPLVFSTLCRLPVSQAMEIVSDHDPKPLYQQMRAEHPGKFDWEDLEIGPDVWRVRITRLDPAPGEGRCCGACGGA